MLAQPLAAARPDQAQRAAPSLTAPTGDAGDMFSDLVATAKQKVPQRSGTAPLFNGGGSALGGGLPMNGGSVEDGNELNQQFADWPDT